MVVNNINKKLIELLSYPGDALPKDALDEAIKHYEDIKPELHAALRLSPDDCDALETKENDYMLQFFAMYLAAEKRDKDAFPLIRDFFADSGKAADEICGDMVCEHLDIEERTSIAFICCDLDIHELETLLLEALKNGRIDPTSMSPEDLSELLRDGQLPTYKQCRYELVDDAADLLNLWFQADEPEEIDIIDMLLQENECKVDGKPIALDFFHGYMQAVVLTPEPLSANEWMPEIFAGKMPEFGSVDEANDVLAVLMGFYNRLNQLRLEKMCGAPGRAVH